MTWKNPNITYREDGHVDTFKLVWSREDFETLAEDQGLDLTDEQLDRAMLACEHGHDANIGISWDVITVYLDMAKDGELD
jgi:hypothetical protein